MKVDEFLKMLVDSDKMIDKMADFGINQEIIDDDDLKLIKQLRSNITQKVRSTPTVIDAGALSEPDRFVDIVLTRALIASSDLSKIDQLNNMMSMMMIYFGDLKDKVMPSEFYSLQKAIKLLASACDTAIKDSKLIGLANDITDDLISNYNSSRGDNTQMKEMIELIKAVDILMNKVGVK